MRSTRPYIVALLLYGCTAGCAPTEETASFRTLDPTPYNRAIERGRQQSWADTPRHIVKHFIGPPTSKEAGPVTYQQINHPNGAVTLTVTLEGVLDDEVYAERYVYTFVAKDGQWAVQQVKMGYNCHRGDAFSGQSCAK